MRQCRAAFDRDTAPATQTRGPSDRTRRLPRIHDGGTEIVERTRGRRAAGRPAVEEVMRPPDTPASRTIGNAGGVNPCSWNN
jgi:hypothetical protein